MINVNRIPPSGLWNSELEESRYDLDLDENSVVIDVGAYIGEWADKITKKYNCRVISYEPVEEFYNKIKSLSNDNIVVMKQALGISNGIEKIISEGESSSIERYGRAINPSHKGMAKNANYKTIEIEVINVDDVMSSLEIVDVMKINTEGSEYELLTRLIETGDIKKIKYIQVQFHSFVDNANVMYENIKAKMDDTHALVIDSRWKWTYWRLKS